MQRLKWKHRYIYVVALLSFIVLGSAVLVTPPPQDGEVAGANTKTVTPTVNTSYLTNPGIGWQHFPGIGDPILPETVEYPHRADISWKVLQPGETTYNWKPLDDKINAAKARGNKIGIRVYTMQGESYGGHHVPQWAISKGIKLIGGAPDYHNCTYQDIWGKFVEVLRQRYDGNTTIAFFDISGYGNFNEWSWEDGFTDFDDTWASAYNSGKASRSTMSIMDSFARRRLADMFIGGSFTGHDCKNTSGGTSKVNYSYPGFQKTQLVMPYAGIRQATQYVFTQRKDVGLRFDCLASSKIDNIMDTKKVGNEIKQIWKQAPIVFEFCAYDVVLSRSDALLKAAHGSLVHDNLEGSNRNQKSLIEEFMKNVGYRYVLKEISYESQVNPGVSVPISMKWHNVGYAPYYKKMGLDFQLQVYLVNAAGQVAATIPVTTDISKWMPAEVLPGTPPDNNVTTNITIPNNLSAGSYKLKVGIRELNDGKNIKLAINGGDSNNMYEIGAVTVGSGSGGGTTNPVCGNGQLETGEICDDGNTQNNDQCSSTCKDKCTAPAFWDGTKCTTALPVGCAADFDKNGVVDVADFGNFASIYKVENVCNLATADDKPSVAGAQDINGWLYNPNSPLRLRIPTDAKYTKETRIGAVRQVMEEWSIPVYRNKVGEKVPLVKVVNTYSGRTYNWPIPKIANPAPEADAHMAVIDPDTASVYEFWDMKWNSARTEIRAGGMVQFPFSKNGISDPPNYRVTASGFSGTAGMILREDLLDPATGKLNINRPIKHSLGMALPENIINDKFIAPAVGSETTGKAGAGGIPMGARFALPKNVDVDSLNIHPLSKMVLRAMRDYGIFVNDGNAAANYNGKGVGTIRFEPGIIKELTGTTGNDFTSRINQETYSVINQYGIFLVEGGTNIPSDGGTAPAQTPTPTSAPTAVCGNSKVDTGEVCDDGNTSNNDQCSSTCKNKCTAPAYWNGTACATSKPAACAADFNKNEIVDVSDFGQFGAVYKDPNICKL